MAAEGGAILAVGVDDDEPVAAVGLHHSTGQDLHQVGFPHAGGGEDPDVGGQTGSGNAHRQVDHRLPAAQLPDRQVAHALGQEGKIGGRRRHHRRKLAGQALGLAKDRPGPVRARFGRSEIPETAAFGHAVGAPLLLVQGMDAGFAALVVRQQGPGDPLGPPRLSVFTAVGHVDDAEDVAAAGGLVHADQELADEEVLVRRRPERRFEHVSAEQPALRRQHRVRSAHVNSVPSAGGDPQTPAPARRRGHRPGPIRSESDPTPRCVPNRSRPPGGPRR